MTFVVSLPLSTYRTRRLDPIFRSPPQAMMSRTRNSQDPCRCGVPRFTNDSALGMSL